jgi:protein required for attachment to host cells
MQRACIAIVDASRARLFTFTRSAEPEGLREELTETRDFVDPQRRLRPSEVFSDSRPGSSRTGSLQYALDDHRGASIEQLDEKFAAMIVDELAELLRSTSAPRLVLCASPHMLGSLRHAIGQKSLPAKLVIDELPRNLTRLTPPELREHLASAELLPAVPPRAS